MKRTLLASAFVVVALAASAQVSEVAKVKGDGFGFIPKSLTTTGVITPYSTIGIDYYYNENRTAEFTVYDASFNVAKTFSYEPKEFKTKTTHMKALADFKTKEILDKGREDDCEYWPWADGVYDYDEGFLIPVATMDEFKAAVAKMTDVTKVVFFTDHNNNFAFHNVDWQSLRPRGEMDNSVTVSENYTYYNPSDNKLHVVKNLIKSVEYDTSNLAWEVDDDSRESYETTLSERICHTGVYDYDANCNESSNGYLSQNVFNNDDKYEFLVESYREVSSPTDPTGSGLVGYINVNGIENGKLVLSKYVQDKFYESYFIVKDEDGKDLFSMPNNSGYRGDIAIFRANGKTYISNYESLGNGLGQYVIYLLDKIDTGITELTRTQAVKSAKTFNMAGMLVGKDAKGIVIQQGGKKYFNK